MEWLTAITAILKLSLFALPFVVYFIGRKNGKRIGREEQRLEDEKEFTALKRQLADTLYRNVDNPNASLRVLSQPKDISKLP